MLAYGIPWGQILVLPSGRAVSSTSYEGLRVSQAKGKTLDEYAIGEAAVEAVTVDGQSALWLIGVPLVEAQVVVETSVTVSMATEDDETPEQEILSFEQVGPAIVEESPQSVLPRTSATALMWEEGDVLLTVVDLDGRFSRQDMIRVAEGFVPVADAPAEKLPEPTAQPKVTAREITSLAEMVSRAQFGVYAVDPLPLGWEMERIIVIERSDRSLDDWYIITYQHSGGASARLTQGLVVPLQLWHNYIEHGGVLRHVTDSALEVWTSEVHQEVEEARARQDEDAAQSALSQVQATFLRAPDGFSVELVAVNASWDETLGLVEHIALAPEADPSLNSRLMKGCYPCP
jgi:hypothetical protein